MRRSAQRKRAAPRKRTRKRRPSAMTAAHRSARGRNIYTGKRMRDRRGRFIKR